MVAIKKQARERAEDLRAVVDDVKATGVTSTRAISKELNRRGILTPRGASWHPTSVKRLLDRLAKD